MAARRKAVLDGGLLIVLGALAVLAGIAYAKGGAVLLGQGLGRGGELLLQFGLLIAISFLAAGVAEVLVPTEWVRANFGQESGLRGLVIATLAGAMTPAGPFTAMPLAAVFVRSGAATSVVVAYLTAWSLLALHRLVAWEVPILGARFALLRFAVSILLPILAGLAVRLIWRS